jgi:hypothetical protein
VACNVHGAVNDNVDVNDHVDVDDRVDERRSRDDPGRGGPREQRAVG